MDSVELFILWFCGIRQRLRIAYRFGSIGLKLCAWDSHIEPCLLCTANVGALLCTGNVLINRFMVYSLVSQYVVIDMYACGSFLIPQTF